MTSRILCAVVCSFLLSWIAPSWAQQPAPPAFNPASIAANPVVERMLQDSEPGETIVELQGYVGPSTPETVRLYGDLSLSRYWDIPRSEILRQVQGDDPTKDPTKLYVRSSTLLASASRMTAEIAVMQKAMINAVGSSSGRRPSSLEKFSGLRSDSGICIGFCSACGVGVGVGCMLCADCLLQMQMP